jgi:hypothetical protein
MCLVFSMASYGLTEFYWYMIAGLSVCLVNIVALDERMLSEADTGFSPQSAEGQGN